MSSLFTVTLIVSVIMFTDIGPGKSLLAHRAFQKGLTSVSIYMLLLIANLIEHLVAA
jgi:hypothetical protein